MKKTISIYHKMTMTQDTNISALVRDGLSPNQIAIRLHEVLDAQANEHSGIYDLDEFIREFQQLVDIDGVFTLSPHHTDTPP